MSLYLYEFSYAADDRAGAERAVKEIDAQVASAGGQLIEAQVTGDHRQLFVVAEFPSCPPAADLAADVDGVAQSAGPDAVRLVGPSLDVLKAARPAAGYLVEWDLPETLDMDSYLARKKANAPKYADVPEVSFLRTYVREDMDKCLCFYDAPDTEAVLRAREAVQTPVDRLYPLENFRG